MSEQVNSDAVRQLPGAEERVETGPVQFGNDWPGLFLRGDAAVDLATDIDAIARRFEDNPVLNDKGVVDVNFHLALGRLKVWRDIIQGQVRCSPPKCVSAHYPGLLAISFRSGITQAQALHFLTTVLHAQEICFESVGDNVIVRCMVTPGTEEFIIYQLNMKHRDKVDLASRVLRPMEGEITGNITENCFGRADGSGSGGAASSESSGT